MLDLAAALCRVDEGAGTPESEVLAVSVLFRGSAGHSVNSSAGAETGKAQGVGFSSAGVASQTRTVWSSLADATRFPSGLNATPKMLLVWPLRGNSSCPVAASHTFTVWLLE
jgi:hypothetical protein